MYRTLSTPPQQHHIDTQHHINADNSHHFENEGTLHVFDNNYNKTY